MAPESIIAAVAAVTGVPAPAITGRRRTREVSMARFLAIAAVRRLNPWWALQQTAQFFRRIDHATVIHAMQRHAELLETDAHYSRCWNEILQDIHQPLTTSQP